MAENKRKAHVYRVYQTDNDGKVTNPDVWVDVMRIDKLTFSEQRGTPSGATHQDRAYVVNWGDDSRHGGPTGPSPQVRIVEPLTITQPAGNGQDPKDPSLASVVIPVIKSTKFFFRGGVSGQQTVQWAFQNFVDQAPDQIASATGRHGKLLRITNNDLNGKDKTFFPPPNIGDPQPPTKQGAQVSWDDYVRALQAGAIDDTNYVDFGTADKFLIRFPPSPFDDPKALQGQMGAYAMVNAQQGNGPIGVEDLFDSPPSSSSSAYLTDPFQCIVNVSWGEVNFLYSGDDGMFGSRDGVNWFEAPQSVPAISLAFAKNTWVGVGRDGQSWSSIDGAQTWIEGGVIPNFIGMLAGIVPKDGGDPNNPQAVFAAVGFDDLTTPTAAQIYTSSDGGAGWSFAQSFPLFFNTNKGNEFPNSLCGCGGAFFLGTAYTTDLTDAGSGRIYVSTDGSAFEPSVVFGPGTNPIPVPQLKDTRSFEALEVAYDQSTGTYTASGRRTLDSQATFEAVTTTSNSPSFGETFGQPFFSAAFPGGEGSFLQAPPSGLGAGAGFTAAAVMILNVGVSGPTSGNMLLGDTSGGLSLVLSAGGPGSNFTQSAPTIAFKGRGYKPGQAITTIPSDPNSTDPTAMFAYVSYAFDDVTNAPQGGGVFTAKAGEDFQLTHSGSPIAGGDPGTPPGPGATVCSGKISFALVSS